MGNKNLPTGIWTFVACSALAAGFTFSLMARDVAVGAPVDVHTTVGDVREVPAGGMLPGLHMEAKVKGKTVDVYIAPMDFVKKYEVKVSKGEEVHIVGTETVENGADVILGREITTGTVDRRTGIFHENMTYYLRNDEGPLW